MSYYYPTRPSSDDDAGNILANAEGSTKRPAGFLRRTRHATICGQHDGREISRHRQVKSGRSKQRPYQEEATSKATAHIPQSGMAATTSRAAATTTTKATSRAPPSAVRLIRGNSLHV